MVVWLGPHRAVESFLVELISARFSGEERFAHASQAVFRIKKWAVRIEQARKGSYGRSPLICQAPGRYRRSRVPRLRNAPPYPPAASKDSDPFIRNRKAADYAIRGALNRNWSGPSSATRNNLINYRILSLLTANSQDPRSNLPNGEGPDPHPLNIAHRSLFTVHCSLFTIHYSLFAICSSFPLGFPQAEFPQTCSLNFLFTHSPFATFAPQ